ncbi:MAG: hypothetical protein LW636_11935 [Planctomycetaceae bacterium]|nr:hypothetical protein [Planctomycetaceae bacterium]
MSSTTIDTGMRLRWRASIGTLALILLAAAWVLGGRTFALVAGEARRAEVDRAFSEVPMLLGAWLGTDVPLPAGAREVLHATGTLSRRYVRIGTNTDYPSQGWQLTNAGGERMSIRMLGQPAAAAVYRFEKPESGGSKSSLSVVGCFLLPGQPSTPDVSRLRAIARDRANSSAGVGQIQIVFGGWPEIADMTAAVQDLLDSFPPDLLETLLTPSTSGGTP